MIIDADVIAGSGRGKEVGFPTLNLNVSQLPKETEPGVYACFARLGEHGLRLPAVVHIGPRPTFGDSFSCEVHVLNHMISIAPRSVHVELVEKLRGVQQFSSKEELQKQIRADIEQARGMLCVSC